MPLDIHKNRIDFLEYLIFYLPRENAVIVNEAEPNAEMHVNQRNIQENDARFLIGRNQQNHGRRAERRPTRNN